MREHVGFDGWRFDYVKGYSGEFTREYVDASVPKLAFGEFWDACNYSDGVLSYNQDSHRQRTVDWCDKTGGTTGAFDFTTKGILQEAVGRNELWRLVDAQVGFSVPLPAGEGAHDCSLRRRLLMASAATVRQAHWNVLNEGVVVMYCGCTRRAALRALWDCGLHEQ